MSGPVSIPVVHLTDLEGVLLVVTQSAYAGYRVRADRYGRSHPETTAALELWRIHYDCLHSLLARRTQPEEERAWTR